MGVTTVLERSCLQNWIRFGALRCLLCDSGRYRGDLYETIQYIPRSPSLNNFANVWVHAGFSQYFANSLQISIVSVSIIVVLSIMMEGDLYQHDGRLRSHESDSLENIEQRNEKYRRRYKLAGQQKSHKQFFPLNLYLVSICQAGSGPGCHQLSKQAHR